MKEKKLTQTFFNQKTAEYHKFAHGERSEEVRKKIKQIIDKEIYGKVIDVGGGGEVHYEIGKSEIFISFDISYQQLKKMLIRGCVYSICGDAESFPFKSNVFEVAICRCFFHHLVRGNVQKSNVLLKKILLEIYEILNQNGKIIIMENCLPKFLEKIENFVFLPFKLLLELFKQPTVRFLSDLTFYDLLKETGFTNIVVKRINEKKDWQLVSLGIILPFFKIPNKFIPTNHFIITGRKP